MAKAEGQNRPFDPITAINTSVLETFPYKLKEVRLTPNGGSDCEIIEAPNAKHIRQTVKYETSELSAVCPFSGLPDIADIEITYVPDAKIMELKSLKYYLMSYRNVGIYQEHLTQRIYCDLETTLKPFFLKIRTKYNTRGGIDSVCEIDSASQQ